MPEELLREIARVTRSGGYLFLTVPFIWGLHELPYDFRRYTNGGIAKVVEQAGFEINVLRKLTEGIDAIQMLVASELNAYFYVNPVPTGGLKFRLLMKAQELLFRVVLLIWRKIARFDRIYIDNLVVAKRK